VDADRRKLLRAAREALRDEEAGGRFLLLPGKTKQVAARQEARPPKTSTTAAASASPAEASPQPAADVDERVRKFREMRAARESAKSSSTAGPADAGGAAGAALPKGLSSKQDFSIFGEKRVTDPSKPAAGRLAEMAVTVEACRLCPLGSTRTKSVFGDGPAGVELVFVGEAPGADEDASGVPFVGRAGQLLNKIIAAMGLKRAEVYICNELKCRPPGNRTPLPGEAAQCWPFLREQIEILKPRVICALGAPAARTLLDTEEPIGRLRGAVHDYHGVPLVATYHPAYLLRSPGEKGKVWEDMKVVLKLLGRPVPKGKGAAS